MEFRLLKANEIDVRISGIKDSGVTLLLYKDARCDMKILDETVGVENWQRQHELINGNLFCNVGIKVGKNNKNRDFDEWIWKQDVGVESYTEKAKGQASDSFKRACFNWGIGRELYTSPFIFVNSKECNITNNNKSCYDKFIVTKIEYDDDRCIKTLEIKNTKTNKICYTFGNKQEYKKGMKQTFTPATKPQINVIKQLCADCELSTEDMQGLRKTYNVKYFKDLSKESADKLVVELNDMKETMGKIQE